MSAASYSSGNMGPSKVVAGSCSSISLPLIGVAVSKDGGFSEPLPSI